MNFCDFNIFRDVLDDIGFYKIVYRWSILFKLQTNLSKLIKFNDEQ